MPSESKKYLPATEKINASVSISGIRMILLWQISEPCMSTICTRRRGWYLKKSESGLSRKNKKTTPVCCRVPSFIMLLERKLLSHPSSYSIYMPFKITVIDKLGKNVLHKGGNGAGIKAQLFLIDIYKMPWKHHISDSQRGGYRL